MKFITPLIFCNVLFINIISSQSYRSNFRNDICQCLQDEFATANNLDKKFSECYRSELTKYATFIDAEIKEENATLKYAKGIKAKRDLEIEFKSELIYSCNFYYNKIEKVRQITLLTSREKDYRNELKRANEYVAASPNNLAYLSRAGIYYYKVGDLEKAMNDTQSSIDFIRSLKSGGWPKSEKLLMALIFEEQKQYDQAIAIYDEIYKGLYDYQIAILRAIVNRKKAGNGSVSESIINQANTVKIEHTTVNTSAETSKRIGRRTQPNNTSHKPTESTTTKTPSNTDLKKLFKIDNKNKKQNKTRQTRRNN